MTCIDDNVAPEMFRMSLPTLSGLALVLPRLCGAFGFNVTRAISGHPYEADIRRIAGEIALKS